MVADWHLRENESGGNYAMPRGHKPDLKLVTNKRSGSPKNSTSLREEVCEALIAIVRDAGAPATARASAARTLLEDLKHQRDPNDAKPLTSMSESEIDDEIRRLGSRVDSSAVSDTDPKR
jgi:hypothetical protein